MTSSGTGGTADRTTCAVVGGGPAGLVLGLLLARAGVRVTVLEKHADFLRDFRGDTVHPSTLAMLDDLGLGERFAALPHSRLARITVPADGGEVVVADFGRLPLRHPYIAMVPQWDLLNLLADAAAEEPTFELRTRHEVTGVVRDGERVVGVDVATPDGPRRLLADLVVACDGRWSTVRRAVGLPSRRWPVPFDVWWVRVPTRHRVGEALLPRLGVGRAAVAIPREGYLQVAYLGHKGTDTVRRARGVAAFRAEVAALVPEVADDVAAIASMDDVKHLDVRLDRLRRWHAPGVLCIGDAAHAMSPVGGVGINLAVQDAVAAARLLAAPLRRGALTGRAGDRVLARIRRRRLMPTVLVQAAQRVVHAAVIRPALDGRLTVPPGAALGVLRRVPALTALPAAFVGIGPRPERVPSWARRPRTG
ncbi:FAD-dependent oxidoreductase [Cellulomonas shaoxiangyii]|uniref:FAD-dependent oxidoreductase n=1 Tax=Cellulomonas shaoxiangyii TaxID=2566013 RepID=A0A4P7SMY3_9CELL|nr:FAD-dependent oxidoreductase [Cellulomonas shaoxiangyii]QCB94887.1 FAD-dependent oxidoreductase [Cellulomonas shaoxiangyii]TGY85116.1 FAD-dependent oxidoreductase [Cellulomonas shaoxiangyii]